MKKSVKILLIAVFVFSAIIVFNSRMSSGYNDSGIDIDECAQGTHNCPPCMQCENLPGSYRCIVNPDCDDPSHNHNIREIYY